MDPELKEICDFIGAIPPFNQLPTEVLDQVVPKMTIRYLRSGTNLSAQADAAEKIYLLRKGAISLLSSDGRLREMLGEADIYSNFCAEAEDQADPFIAQTTEDTLLYTLPTEVIKELTTSYPAINSFFYQY